MDKQREDMARVITGLRRCFQLLATVSDEMIRDLGLTAALRAMLEHLSQAGPQTVPQVAREKSVKRQSIQELVDQLRERGLVETMENPAHRRSGLIKLTRNGQQLFKEVQRREAAELKNFVKLFDRGDLAATADSLEVLRNALQTRREGDIENVGN